MKFGKVVTPAHWKRVGTPRRPRPLPRPVHTLTAYTEQGHGRGTGEPPPHPSRAAAPSFLSAGAAAAHSIGPTGLTAPHGPRGRQRPAAPSDPLNSHRLTGLPVAVSTDGQTGDWARHSGAISGR